MHARTKKSARIASAFGALRGLVRNALDSIFFGVSPAPHPQSQRASGDESNVVSTPIHGIGSFPPLPGERRQNKGNHLFLAEKSLVRQFLVATTRFFLLDQCLQ